MNSKKIVQGLIHGLNIFFIGLTVALALISIFKKEWIEAFIEWMKIVVEGLGFWNYIIVFFSSLIEAFPVIGTVLPGQNILMIVGGFFGKLSNTHLIYVGLLACGGAIVGNYIGYLLGAKYGDTFFRKYGNWFGIGLTEVKYLKQSIHKWGAWGIIFGKFHPLTRAFLPFVAGSMGMHNKKFMLYNVVGSIIWSITMVVLGMIFVEYYQVIIDNFGKIMLVIMAGIGIYIYLYKKEQFITYWKEKEQEMEELYGKK